MNYQGVLTKMQTENGSPIQYYLVFENDFLHVNQLLDKKISINFLRYQCLNCNLQKKVYRQGFCYDCFFDSPQTAAWIISPELSKAHLGIEDRDLEYEKRIQLRPHVVYLANSSNIKVGVTRKTQLPTRWIDQGAHEAIEIVEVPNRYLAGIVEMALKNHISDKTNWRMMLKNDLKDEDLVDWRNNLKQFIPEEASEYFLENNLETHLEFPVLRYPTVPKPLNLVKTPFYEGVLKGIKGQYLLFEDNTVFNVRANEGCVVSITVN
ncbi:DUF2797 domain-containing protein [Aequorivita sp. H23M31]|uniref:DUF2797 domain-containing protein n=1 Tax=Aequorivita ciconiae TaxID=2494375 RepID=A0A410G3S5_9FLAO|nr:DUF2797 domain-containing protein [Aequorivita sp. H23M31]QAA81901.1 DUF2797 domain-containing protein [Aequorivita sp. H23M31]